MGDPQTLTLKVCIRKHHLLIALGVFLICAHPELAGSETLALTTYYPAPYGGYVSILTTGQTSLARDGGNVGIGLSNPSAKLEVAGEIKITGGAPGQGKVLVSDSSGLATWGYGTLPKCSNILTPEASNNRPCNANVYRCPFIQVVLMGRPQVSGPVMGALDSLAWPHPVLWC